MSDETRGGLAAARVERDGSAIVFTRNWSARASLARVIDATRLDLTPELHPLITRVESLRVQGGASECVLHEFVPLGPLRIPNKYRAARRVVEASALCARIELDGWASLGVRLRHELALCAAGERTEVTHVVRVTAPRPLRAFVARTAQRAHDAWVARVVAWAERERGAESA
jgi:hypothetical protein